jgi:hypothetical protein
MAREYSPKSGGLKFPGLAGAAMSRYLVRRLRFLVAGRGAGASAGLARAGCSLSCEHLLEADRRTRGVDSMSHRSGIRPRDGGDGRGTLWRRQGRRRSRPTREATVRGEDHGALFVAGVDELKEQIAPAGRDRQIADVIDDQQREAAEVAGLLPKRPFAFGPGQRGDDVGEGRKEDAAASFDAQRQTEMGFPRAWRSDEMDGFGAVDELCFGQRHDPPLVERGLEGEGKLGERLDSGQARHLKR